MTGIFEHRGDFGQPNHVAAQFRFRDVLDQLEQTTLVVDQQYDGVGSGLIITLFWGVLT